ncbi:MAG: S-layer homology domain-containing protein [Oscillospiraceae bacterium]|nr:S-layer homology domain-containing protein [Oscillospiraceae bacterium]
MKKTTMKTAAAIMAAMLAGTACAPIAAAVYTPAVPTSKASGTTAGKKEDASMKAALTEVKKRIDVPEELSEFTYAESKVYSKTGYNFNWNTPNGAKEHKSINVTIIGGVITEYSRQGFGDDDGFRSYEPRLAKLSQQEVLAKAKESFKKINPDIYNECKFELSNLSLTSSEARVAISRSVNGVDVYDNGGSIRINQNTGELAEISLTWWEGAKFSDAKTAKTEADIQEAYKTLCTLTPYYRISYKWDEKSKKSKPTVRIVYAPDYTDEIDAYTGKASTIWEDMEKAGGSRYYGNVMYANPATGIGYDITADAGYGMDDDALDEEVSFSEEELKKLDQNSKLLKTDDVTALLKKDKFVALTDSYKLKNYNVSSQKDDSGKESFTMYVSYELDTKKPTAKDYYKYVTVTLDAETGKILNLNKYGDQIEKNDFDKLDVKKANAVAEEVAKTYAKDIFSQYKADKSNSEPVKVIDTIEIMDQEKNKKIKENLYEKNRTFVFNRFANGIQVSNNTIRVTVDINGVVTYYDTDHTENITFPAADVISTDEAFKKLFEQKEFKKYYNGWVTKDGEFKTYLLYDMDGFTLNAKSGKICNWDGSVSETSSTGYYPEAKFTDIKDIPQREAILEMQKYGVTLRTDGKKFLPDTPITEAEFSELLANLFGDAVVFADEVDIADDDSPEAKAQAEAEKKDRAETTRREAAVMFAQMYDHSRIAELSGIFRSFYSDIKTSDENAGHIAIAYAKGFFGKTADGKFHSEKVITRAEAVQLIYDYLKLLSK